MMTPVDLAGLTGLLQCSSILYRGAYSPAQPTTDSLPLPLCCCGVVHYRLMSLLQQPSDEPVAVRLVAFAAALLPVILASGLAYKYASNSSLANALYKASLQQHNMMLLGCGPGSGQVEVTVAAYLPNRLGVWVLRRFVRAEDCRALVDLECCSCISGVPVAFLQRLCVYRTS